MKKLIIIATMLLFAFGMLFAKGADSTRTSIGENAKCLQFGIRDNFIYYRYLLPIPGLITPPAQPFQGSSISYKKHISRDHAYRVGITLNGEIRDGSRISDHHTDSDSLYVQDNINYKNLSIALQGQYLTYSRSKHSYFYYGYGPKLTYSHAFNERVVEENSNIETLISEELRKEGSHTLAFGAVVLAGVEIFITRSVSIHGEYSQGISYQYTFSEYYRDDNDGEIYQDSRKYHIYSLDAGGVKFGCSFYW
ncbi:MAG: hypothetical protein R6V48_01305 [Fidelibacterota bacterium]